MTGAEASRKARARVSGRAIIAERGRDESREEKRPNRGNFLSTYNHVPPPADFEGGDVQHFGGARDDGAACAVDRLAT